MNSSNSKLYFSVVLASVTCSLQHLILCLDFPDGSFGFEATPAAGVLAALERLRRLLVWRGTTLGSPTTVTVAVPEVPLHLLIGTVFLILLGGIVEPSQLCQLLAHRDLGVSQ